MNAQTELIKHTNQEHYEKYKNMARQLGLTLKDSVEFMGLSRDQWVAKFKADEWLNNVPLRKWDALAPYVMARANRARLPVSLSDCVCVYKWLVTYEIIGAVPKFRE